MLETIIKKVSEACDKLPIQKIDHSKLKGGVFLLTVEIIGILCIIATIIYVTH